jgi:hypothetical protein
MGRFRLILRLYWSICCVLATAGLVRGEEPADEQLQKLAQESHSRAESIQVSVAVGERTTKAMVHTTPLMKYTDVPRLIEMATLWVWQDEGCPVALGKVEAYRRKGGPMWLYCFTSASTGLVEATWPDGRRFQARKPGIEWTTIKGPVPQETPAGRRRQMKELFRRFSATARDEVLKTSDELRPLARPLHEYSSPRRGVVQGILCGFAANGTNPDLIVALEAVRPAQGKDGPISWRYGVIGMTASGVTVKLDDAEAFSWPYSRSPGDRDTWTYFWERAPRK